MEGKFDSVAFDVDGTLTEGNSWLTLTERLGANPNAHLGIYQNYRNGRINYAESIEGMVNLWRSTGNANRTFIQQELSAIPLRPEAEDLIAAVRRLGSNVLLISGSMDMFVSNVAERLQIKDYYYNSRLVFSETGELESLDYTLAQSDLKVRQLAGYCALRSLEPNQVAVVGDGENDIGIFDYTSRGIQLSSGPPNKLTSVAWRVVQGLADIPPLLSGG